MQILKFTNDGSELVMRLVDRDHPTTIEAARANPNPGPYTYAMPAVLAFLPDGSFLLGDGYWNSRIVKYDASGEYMMEFGELGSGPGQFDLIHGLAVDRDRRIYVGDRNNNRIQVFTENGEFIEEWPGISDPVGVFIDENDAVWVISARLHRLLKYDRDGQLVTGTFVDYLVPTSTDFPRVEAITLDGTPSNLNPLGVKGAGEGGIVAVAAAAANAVADALAEFRVEVTELPISPANVQRWLHAADTAKGGG